MMMSLYLTSMKTFKIKEEFKEEYESLPYPFLVDELNVNKEKGIYYHWRIKDEDELYCTKIKIDHYEEYIHKPKEYIITNAL